jgi:hypothetical protein
MNDSMAPHRPKNRVGFSPSAARQFSSNKQTLTVEVRMAVLRG